MSRLQLFSITGLTCKNCATKVKTALASQKIMSEISEDLTKISLNIQPNQLLSLNAILKKAGNYHISPLLESSQNVAANNNVIDTSDEISDKNATKPKHLLHFWSVYQPLILVFVYILLVTLAIEYANGSFNLHRFMRHFMAGFFLVFSFFKLLDLSGFAKSYAMYDLLAKKWPMYGFIYPFIELALGAAYLLAYKPVFINSITLFVMLFSSIGVILAVLNKQKIQCACLGTGFNLPMTTVTIVEDLTMVAMAAWMLI